MTYYHIVPINDGYHYLCRNENGYYLQHKAIDLENLQDALCFTTEEAARMYIEAKLDTAKYKPEWVEKFKFVVDGVAPIIVPPTAEWRIVKRGEWLYDRSYYEADECYCSLCNQLMTTAKGLRMNFCPNCGADMRKENG